MERLRQTNVGQLINTVQTMGQINEAESRGELNEAQADLARQRTIHAAGLDEANIERLKLESERLRLTNPGSVEAQAAETRYRNAVSDALANKLAFEKRTEPLTIQKLESELQRTQQDIDAGKRDQEVTLSDGRKVRMTSKQYMEYLTRLLDSEGKREGLTDWQQLQSQRQRKLDVQNEEEKASEAESKIVNNPKLDTTAQADIFNARARKDYIYLPTPRGWIDRNRPYGPAGDETVKIPIPKIKTSEGKERQYQAWELYDLYQNSPTFKGMTFKEFIIDFYKSAGATLPDKLK